MRQVDCVSQRLPRMPELDDLLRDAKASLERLAGAEKEAQDLRVQRDALAREVAGLTKELESRKEMEREHDAKYAESLHAATLLSGGSCRTLLFRAISRRERAGRRLEEVPRGQCQGAERARRDRGCRARAHRGAQARARPCH